MKFLLFLLALSTGGFASETERPVPMKDYKQCNVTHWGAHWVSGGRCQFMQDVMVGFDFTSNSAICARTSVECPTRAIDETAQAERSEE